MATTLMVDYIISLDGYGAGEGWPGFWGLEGPEYLAWLGEDAQDGLIHLMGIFDDYPDVALELVQSRTFDGRLQLLEYIPTVLDGPPVDGDGLPGCSQVTDVPSRQRRISGGTPCASPFCSRPRP